MPGRQPTDGAARAPAWSGKKSPAIRIKAEARLADWSPSQEWKAAFDYMPG